MLYFFKQNNENKRRFQVKELEKRKSGQTERVQEKNTSKIREIKNNRETTKSKNLIILNNKTNALTKVIEKRKKITNKQ